MPMPAHMTLEGEKQGVINGSCAMRGRENTILIEACSNPVLIPTDPQTGLSTGKRVHKPFTIVKLFDKSTPQLFQACCTGEHFKNVTLKWYRINPQGKEEHYFTHTLSNAVIVAMRCYMENCLDTNYASRQHEEEVQFTFEKITWTWVPDGVESEDSWQVPV